MTFRLMTKKKPLLTMNTERFRSGLEAKIAGSLRNQGVTYEYEQLTLPFVQPEQNRKYTPDFRLPNGIIIEAKGQFVTADRKKHLWIKEQYPDLDIRFVFSNSNTKIGKTSQTTYAKWCEQKGFQYADKDVPKDWIKE